MRKNQSLVSNDWSIALKTPPKFHDPCFTGFTRQWGYPVTMWRCRFWDTASMKLEHNQSLLGKSRTSFEKIIRNFLFRNWDQDQLWTADHLEPQHELYNDQILFCVMITGDYHPIIIAFKQRSQHKETFKLYSIQPKSFSNTRINFPSQMKPSIHIIPAFVLKNRHETLAFQSYAFDHDKNSVPGIILNRTHILQGTNTVRFRDFSSL